MHWHSVCVLVPSLPVDSLPWNRLPLLLAAVDRWGGCFSLRGGAGKGKMLGGGGGWRHNFCFDCWYWYSHCSYSLFEMGILLCREVPRQECDEGKGGTIFVLITGFDIILISLGGAGRGTIFVLIIGFDFILVTISMPVLNILQTSSLGCLLLYLGFDSSNLMLEIYPSFLVVKTSLSCWDMGDVHDVGHILWWLRPFCLAGTWMVFMMLVTCLVVKTSLSCWDMGDVHDVGHILWWLRPFWLAGTWMVFMMLVTFFGG